MKKQSFEQNTLTELSDEQIAELKKEYGDIYLIRSGEKKVYLHKPTRQIIDLAQMSAKTRPSMFEEVIIKNCWLAGNKEVLDDDAVDDFYAISAQVGTLVSVKEAELKKL